MLYILIILILSYNIVHAAEPPPSVLDYGAVCDNQTDDYHSLSNALTNQRGKALHIPEGRICYTSGPLTMIGGSLYSNAGALQNPPGFLNTGGGVIRCGTSKGVACLTITGRQDVQDAAIGSPLLKNIGIYGTAGTGVLATKTYNAVLDGVIVQGFDIGIYAQAVATKGISIKLHNVETCRIRETDLLIDSIPETRINMMRFGCNGDYTIRSGAYITIIGGGPGPNGLFVHNSQFNAGSGGARCFISFERMGHDQRSGIISEWTLVGNHFESGYPNESGICSDASIDLIYRLSLSSNWFLNSGQGNKFLNLNPRTTIYDSDITGNHFIGWSGGFDLSPTQPFYNLIINGNQFQNTPVSITGIWPSVILATQNLFEGLNISGSFYEGVAEIGGINNGPLNNNATGIVTTFRKKSE